MKKIIILIFLTLFLLGACTPAPQAVATQMPTTPNFSPADTSSATPAAGYAVVRRFEGMEALRLHSQPDPQSPEAGRAAPGAKGKLIGLNAGGTWALVKFEDPELTGWAPVPTLDLVIAQ